MSLLLNSGVGIGQLVSILLGASIGFWFWSLPLGVVTAFALVLLVDIREELIKLRGDL